MKNHKKTAVVHVKGSDSAVSLLSDEEKKMIKGSGSGDNGLPPKHIIKTHRPSSL